jgi:hypothetical protein
MAGKIEETAVFAQKKLSWSGGSSVFLRDFP